MTVCVAAPKPKRQNLAAGSAKGRKWGEDGSEDSLLPATKTTTTGDRNEPVAVAVVPISVPGKCMKRGQLNCKPPPKIILKT